MKKDSRIYIAGHRGLVGSALQRHLSNLGYKNLLVRSRADLDLTDAAAIDRFFSTERPDFVFLAAAKVGGILANSKYPADFIADNLRIQQNVIQAAHHVNVDRLLFLGSSCIYPKHCPQPIREEYLMTGELEPTNRPYAIAKIAGIELCWAFNRQYGTQYLSVMPTNLYGPDDNFDLETAHVLPALIRKVAEAKRDGRNSVTVWGTGTPRRELLYSEDCAEACVFLMALPEAEFAKLVAPDIVPLINIGTGQDITIREIAEMVSRVLGFAGEIILDPGKPDGTPRKLLDVSRIQQLGWRAKISLEDGILSTYNAYREKTAGI